MFRLAFLVFLAAVSMGVSPVAAQPRRMPQGDVQPLDRFLPQVRRHYPGTFYDADGPYRDEAGNPHYSLKWMTPEGRVIWLDTDARTGRVLGVQHGGMRGGYRYSAPPPDERAPPEFYPREREPFGGPPGGGFFRERGNGFGSPWGRGGRGGGWNQGRGGGWGGGHGGGHGHHGG